MKSQSIEIETHAVKRKIEYKIKKEWINFIGIGE